jgi:phage terminase large subunit
LRQLGRAPIGVQFAGEAHNKSRYVNKRAEMYLEAVEWIKRGGALPESAELLAALTQTTYAFKGDRFLLEPKEDVKAKIGFSPDEADAFALTFAERVASKREQARSRNRRPYTPAQQWDPFREPDDPRW